MVPSVRPPDPAIRAAARFRVRRGADGATRGPPKEGVLCHARVGLVSVGSWLDTSATSARCAVARAKLSIVQPARRRIVTLAASAAYLHKSRAVDPNDVLRIAEAVLEAGV